MNLKSLIWKGIHFLYLIKASRYIVFLNNIIIWHDILENN